MISMRQVSIQEWIDYRVANLVPPYMGFGPLNWMWYDWPSYQDRVDNGDTEVW